MRPLIVDVVDSRQTSICHISCLLCGQASGNEGTSGCFIFECFVFLHLHYFQHCIQLVFLFSLQSVGMNRWVNRSVLDDIVHFVQFLTLIIFGARTVLICYFILLLSSSHRAEHRYFSVFLFFLFLNFIFAHLKT